MLTNRKTGRVGLENRLSLSRGTCAKLQQGFFMFAMHGHPFGYVCLVSMTEEMDRVWDAPTKVVRG